MGFNLKYILCLLLAFVRLPASATNYYVSNTGNDSNDGLSTATSWATTAKVNAVSNSFNPGDNILFKAGDTFFGNIFFTKSGTYGQPITLGSYGSGAKPVITGFINLNTWTNAGGNIWTSNVITSTIPGMVTVNGVPAYMGRYPNFGTANGGYKTITGTNANTSISDATLSGSPNFTGGKIVLRLNNYIIRTDSITNHTGNTITYAATSGYYPSTGFGYIVTNHINTLDIQNEWYFNPSTRVLNMYSSTSPTNVKISVIDTLIAFRDNNYITINGLALDGCNIDGASLNPAGTYPARKGITITNSSITNSGRNAIYGNFVDSLTITNNIITTSCCNGINMGTDGGIPNVGNVTGNILTNIGLNCGMYFNGTGTNGNQGIGISVANKKLSVINNVVNGTGFNGIQSFYEDNTIKNNVVKKYCSQKHDGGGIYLIGGPFTTRTNILIDRNFVDSAIGAHSGTNDSTNNALGIYLDDNSAGVSITNNVVSNATYASLYLHNVNNILVRGNTLYKSDRFNYAIVHDTYGSATRNVRIVSDTAYNAASGFQFDISSLANDLDSIGVIDSIVHIDNVANKWHTTTPAGGNGVYTSLSAVRAGFQCFGANCSEAVNNIPESFISNTSDTVTTIRFQRGIMRDLWGNVYTNKYTLQPRRIVYLFPYGVVFRKKIRVRIG